MSNQKSDTQKELLLQMHQQFSENQNDIGTRFNVILIALVSLFAVYGFSYGSAVGFINKDGLEINKTAVYSLAIVVEIVLVFLITLLIYMGYQHRRDQAMNTKIRKKYVGDDFDHFFEHYTERGKTILSFIPDFLAIKAVFLVALNILLFLSLLILPSLGNAQNIQNIDSAKLVSANAQVVFNKTVNVQSDSKTQTLIKFEPLEIKPIDVKINLANLYKANSESNTTVLCWGSVLISMFGFIIIICQLSRYQRKYLELNKNPIETTVKQIERDSEGRISKIETIKTYK